MPNSRIEVPISQAITQLVDHLLQDKQKIIDEKDQIIELLTDQRDELKQRTETYRLSKMKYKNKYHELQKVSKK